MASITRLFLIVVTLLPSGQQAIKTAKPVKSVFECLVIHENNHIWLHFESEICFKFRFSMEVISNGCLWRSNGFDFVANPINYWSQQRFNDSNMLKQVNSEQDIVWSRRFEGVDEFQIYGTFTVCPVNKQLELSSVMNILSLYSIWMPYNSQEQSHFASLQVRSLF